MTAREREALASIEELFDQPDEGAAADSHRPNTLRSWLVKAMLGAAVVAGGIFVVLLPLGLAVPFPLIYAAVFTSAVLWRSLSAVAAAPLPIDTLPPGIAAGRHAGSDKAVDGLQAALARWDQRLSWTQKDPARFASVVRPRLGEIADERLRQRHGVIRASDPARARELMGEELWGFLHGPLPGKATPRQVASMVERMEKL